MTFSLFFRSTELQRRRELGIVFRKRDKGSGQHIEDKEEKLKYSILIKSNAMVMRAYRITVCVCSCSRRVGHAGGLDQACLHVQRYSMSTGCDRCRRGSDH